MAEGLIIKFLRSDSAGDYILVNVIPQKSSPLDLQLVATEGEAPYVGNITQKTLSKLRTKNYQGSSEQWQQIISWVFLRKRPNSESDEIVKGLETVAIVDGERLEITVRKNIDGITQRLGTIALRQEESQAIELFEWAGNAVAASTSFETEVASISAKYQEQQEVLTKLNEQLEGLIKAKEEHEEILLEKFMKLLNEKKLKIRDQQRLLAGAKVDPAKQAHVREARGSTKSRNPTASRTRKRKADVEPIPAASESGDDDFEKMEIDQEDDLERGLTPDKSDLDATEDEDEDDLGSVGNTHGQAAGLGSKGKVIEVAKDKDGVSATRKATPPPPRVLPFAEKPKVKESSKGNFPDRPKVATTNDSDESETAGETDDDEL